MEHDIREKVQPGGFWQSLLITWLRRDEEGYVCKRFNAKQEALSLLRAT